jgi:uncharacterized protein
MDRDHRTRRLAALLLVLQLAVPALAEPAYPKLTGRVTDAAGVLPADAAAALDARLAALEQATGAQLVVATVPDLDGQEIEDYGVGLLRHWGIGTKDRNNGAILLVAPNQRRVRIEVGYGLEGVITDALASGIIRRQIVPRFKAGDMAGGITAGADALIAVIGASPEERANAAQAAAGGGQDDGPGWGALVWLVIIIVWIIMASRPGARGRRRGPVVVWGPGIGGGWGGGGGFGGGGFGGFSGGGGSGGGGGASGGW